MKRIFVVLFLSMVTMAVSSQDMFRVVSTQEWDELYQSFDVNYDFDIMETVVFDSPFRPEYNHYFIFSHYQGAAVIATLVEWDGNRATVTRKFQGNIESFNFDAEKIASMFLYPSDNVGRMTVIYALGE
jgi:hypothetical protein